MDEWIFLSGILPRVMFYNLIVRVVGWYFLHGEGGEAMEHDFSYLLANRMIF